MAADEDNVPEAPAPKSASNKILPIILVVNTLLMTGVLIFVMKRPSAQAAGGGKEHAAEGKEHEEPAKKEGGEGHGESGEHGAAAPGDGPGPSMRLDNFIVQVRAPEGDRYAHMTLEVEIGTEADKKAFESRMPRIRDGVIGYLADRNEDELRGSEGLTQMKEALVKKLDEIVPGHRVHGLFITEFIIQ
ncbi:MAG: flagellar basal body-associated FliL family protein [Polyangia bacterium]